MQSMESPSRRLSEKRALSTKAVPPTAIEWGQVALMCLILLAPLDTVLLALDALVSVVTLGKIAVGNALTALK